MSPTECAYVAGLIDGEGYIGIKRRKAKSDKHSPVHESSIKVKMVDEKIIRWLYEKFGGAFYKEMPKPNQRKRIAYVWAVSGEKAEIVLKYIVPFLIVKKQQAELLLEYFQKRTPNKGQSPTEEELALREHFTNAIQSLNYGRGIYNRLDYDAQQS